MTITERTLREWRRQALKEHNDLAGWDSSTELTSINLIISDHRRETAERILRLTQELLDLALLKRSKS